MLCYLILWKKLKNQLIFLTKKENLLDILSNGIIPNLQVVSVTIEQVIGSFRATLNSPNVSVSFSLPITTCFMLFSFFPVFLLKKGTSTFRKT